MLSRVPCPSQLLGAARRPRTFAAALWCTVPVCTRRQGTTAACSAAGVASQKAGASQAATATYVATSEPALQQLAAALADDRQAGDCYCLFGAVGAGKSVFSRAFIRAAVGDPDLTVPSPTFLLQQIYDECEGAPIHHFDLYRLLGGRADLQRLNLSASFEQSVSLVEWAERLQEADMLPSSRLDVYIEALDKGTSIQLSIKQQGLRQLRDDTSSTGGTFGLAEGHAEQEAEQEAEHDPYTDQRWRRVQLQAHGALWQQRLQRLAAAMLHHESLIATDDSMS